jgi:hypothetical protein
MDSDNFAFKSQPHLEDVQIISALFFKATPARGFKYLFSTSPPNDVITEPKYA